MDKIILEVGFDDHASYFSTTVDAIKEVAKLPVKDRWDELYKKCEVARIHTDKEVDFFLDLTLVDEDDDSEDAWQTLLDEIKEAE